MRSVLIPLLAAAILAAGGLELTRLWATEEVSVPLNCTASAVPYLTSTLYVLPAGVEDWQQPHEEDEVYCIVRGRAALEVGGELRPVRPGSVVYIKAGTEHRFRDIEEEVEAVIFRRSGRH